MRSKTAIAAASCAISLLSSTAWSAEGGGVELEEIIVTAQRASQDVEKVPLAIEVLSADQLETKGVTNLYSLDREVAGLHIVDIGPSVNIIIRGIGNQSALSTSDPTAAFNVDGVYRSRATALNGVMFDLARVEVVKGPMGTLYGRNATNGAVNVISNAPTQETQASGTVETGNYDLMRAQGMVNAPLSDDLAFRASFGFLRHEGYQTDGYNDADQVGMRGKLLYTPAENLSLLTTADYARQGGYGQGNVILHPQAIGEAPNPLYAVPAGASDWYGNEAPGNLNNQDWGLTTEINYDLGWSKLFAQPAYRDTSSTNRGFSSGSRAGIVNDFDSRQWTGEVRLSQPDSSRVKWVAGVYYYSEALINTTALTSTNVNPANAAAIPTPDRHRNYTVADLDTRAYAAFGQLTLPIVDRFRLIAGGRYTKEKRELGGIIYQVDYNSLTPDVQLPLPALNNQLSAANDSSHVDWKGGLELDVTSNSLLYASASTGFKAGGLNPVNTASTGPLQAEATYQPEELLEYTMGLKNRLFNNRMTLNVSYFHWDYKDRQGLTGGPIGAGVVVSNTTGSGAALANPFVCANPPPGIVCNFVNIKSGRQVMQGVDLDGALAISENDSLSWTLAWLDAKYAANDPLNAGTAVLVAGTSVNGTNGTNPGLGAVDLRGKRVSFAPDWTVNVDYSHDFKLTAGKILTFTVGAQWVSDQDVNANLGMTQNPAQVATNPIGAQASLQPAYWTGDANLAYKPSSRFTTSLWVRNIGNEAVKGNASQAINPGIGAPPTAPYNNSVWLATMRPPRTYGISFSAKMN